MINRYDSKAYRIRARASSGNCCEAIAEMEISEGGDYIEFSDYSALLMLAKELRDALTIAKARVHDMEIIFTEAAEFAGITFRMCGSTYDKAKIEATIQKASSLLD